MRYSKNYRIDLSGEVFAPNKVNENVFDKIRDSLKRVLAEKFGMCKGSCTAKGYSEIEISVEELKILFDRSDKVDQNFRDHWQEDLEIAGKFINGLLEKSEEASIRILRSGVNVYKEYEKMNDELEAEIAAKAEEVEKKARKAARKAETSE